jgi:hypothetical protein
MYHEKFEELPEIQQKLAELDLPESKNSSEGIQ